MTIPTAKQTVTLTLRNEPGHEYAPFAVRLRRLLKCMLRSYGLRCVSIGPSGPDETGRGEGDQKSCQGRRPT